MSLLSQYHFKGRQEQAATDPNPRIAVTAGAGAGKTLTLVARYLHLLEQGYPLRSILAITFTEKAAREMRIRTRAAIAHLTRDNDSAFFISYSDLDSARIGTIHSLCAEILRAYPSEAGLDPAFEVLEGGLAAALQAQAIDSALAWAVTDDSLAALFASFKESDLREILRILMSHRLDISSSLLQEKGWGDKKKFSSRLASYLVAHLDSPAWTDALAALASQGSPVPEDKLEFARRDVLAQWDKIQAARASENWDAALAGLAALRKAISIQGKKDNWDDIESVRAAMTDLRSRYDEQLKFLAEKARFSLDEQLAGQLPALQCLFSQVLIEYQTHKEERQALDFDDLEGLTAQLLVGHPEVRLHLQSELRAVLVDEFQDTNDRQRQIVYTLAGFDPQSAIPPASDAENHPASIVNLFIVGDSKQSIYRFRQADVTVFRQVQDDIRSAGGLCLDLNLTFRAHNGLLGTLNALLAPILGEEDDPARPYVVPFTSLTAYRHAAREKVQFPFVEFHLGLGASAEEGRLAAAQSLVGRLLQLHENEGFAWGEMALLFRSSIAFFAYENALQQADIPFVTVAGRGFYDRPEIRDLLNALAAIADPDDDLALAGLLRSPAFALSDTEIYRLCFPNPSSPRASKIIESLRASIQHQSSSIQPLPILDELHELSGREPAAAVLKRFLDLTDYLAILSSVPSGGRMIRNVEKLLADAHRSRLVNLNDFLAYVQTLRDVGLREGESPADPLAGSGGAVQLMTVHKAKGLEFPLVVLADASYEHRSAGGKVWLTPDGPLPDLKDGDFHSTAWQFSARLEEMLEDAEDRRLLYVAATRSSEKLLVSGQVKTKKDGSPSLAGWLERLGMVIGLDQMKISGDMSEPKAIPLEIMPGCSLTLYPVSTAEDGADSSQPVFTSSVVSASQGDLLDPLPEGAPVTDETTRLREADPPQRVWRVVAETSHPRPPAWVVGRLVHEALHRWRFPNRGSDRLNPVGLDDFLHPFALEAGLTDPTEIHTAVQESCHLLERLVAHPLFVELDSAERHHEVPYFLPAKYPQGDERGVIDLLYRTDSGWYIIDFKTDEIRTEEQAILTIQREGYDAQVRRYARAVADQLKVQAKTRLVFLNVENRLVIYDLQENP